MEGRLNFVWKLQILRSKVYWIHSKMYNFWQAQSQSNPIWIDWTEIALIPTTILALQPTHSKMKGKKNLTTKMFFLTLTFFDIKKFNLAQLQSKTLWAWQSSVPACLYYFVWASTVCNDIKHFKRKTCNIQMMMADVEVSRLIRSG